MVFLTYTIRQQKEMSPNDNSSIKQLLQERRQVKGGATDTAVDPAWSGLAPFNTEMAHGVGGEE